MASRSVSINTAALDRLAKHPSGSVGRYLAGKAGEVTKAARQLADERLNLGPGEGGHYRDKFTSTIVGTSSGLRATIGNTKTTRSGRALGPIIEHGARPHVITPRRAGGVLVFQVGGVTVFARRVAHPGQKARNVLRDALRRTFGFR